MGNNNGSLFSPIDWSKHVMERGWETLSFNEIHGFVKTQKYTIPTFQRAAIWSSKKIESWARSIVNWGQNQNQWIPSVVMVYQITGKPGPIFILDGVQRINANKTILDNPSNYNLSSSDIVELLTQLKCHVIKCLFHDNEEAFRAYQRINQGTVLNPEEYYKGILTEGLGSRYQNWEEYIALTLQELKRETLTISNLKTSSRDTGSKIRRYLYCILWSFWDGKEFYEQGKWPFDRITKRDYSTSNICIESKIVELHNQWDKNEQAKYDEARKYLLTELAYLKDCWYKAKMELGMQDAEMLVSSLLMNLFAWGIYRDKNKLSIELWTEFVRQIFKETKGQGRISIDRENRRDREIPITYGNCSLNTIMEWWGWREKFFPGRRKRGRPLKTGFHIGHKKPFVLFGNGETAPESSKLNMSKQEKHIQGGES
jgi:hypothetical protein